jgi:hypothetical protein
MHSINFTFLSTFQKVINNSKAVSFSLCLFVGYLGELTLVIPWSNLRSEPVKIIIDHVYLLAEPKSEATVNRNIYKKE